MAVFTFDQALKKEGVTADKVGSIGVPTPTPSPAGKQSTIGTLLNPLMSGVSGLKTLYGGGDQGIANKLKEDITSGAQDIQQGANKVTNIFSEGNQSNIDAKTQIAKGIIKSGARVAGDVAGAIYAPVGAAIGATGIGKVFNFLGELSQKGGKYNPLNAITDMKSVQNFVEQHPNLGEDFGRALNLAFGAVDSGKIDPTTVVPRTIEQFKSVADKTSSVVKPITNTVSGITDQAKTSLFGRPKQFKNIDEVVNEADQSLKSDQVLNKTEQATAIPSLKEKWAGVATDIKNRIAGKATMLKDYFDTAHARNNFDTVDTPLEHGVKIGVDPAVSKMESLINDKGSQIGQFRDTIGTYEAPIDKIRGVEDSFNGQLNKLNLEVKNGSVRQIPGTVKRIGADSEVGILNDLYGELQTVKQNPSLQKLIDLRNLFDNKINFAKTAREASNTLDTLSRTVRKQIADTAAQIVGKEQAGKLKEYSDFMDGYQQLKSFTDRKAGAEFLLKQALSERGRLPREVMSVIKKYTGIDLMDHAVMSSLATDLIGNVRQKGLFRQELTKAGLDAEAALKGNMTGILNLLSNGLKKTNVLNPEKIYLNAAK